MARRNHRPRGHRRSSSQYHSADYDFERVHHTQINDEYDKHLYRHSKDEYYAEQLKSLDALENRANLEIESLQTQLTCAEGRPPFSKNGFYAERVTPSSYAKSNTVHTNEEGGALNRQLYMSAVSNRLQNALSHPSAQASPPTNNNLQTAAPPPSRRRHSSGQLQYHPDNGGGWVGMTERTRSYSSGMLEGARALPVQGRRHRSASILQGGDAVWKNAPSLSSRPPSSSTEYSNLLLRPSQTSPLPQYGAGDVGCPPDYSNQQEYYNRFDITANAGSEAPELYYSPTNAPPADCIGLMLPPMEIGDQAWERHQRLNLEQQVEILNNSLLMSRKEVEISQQRLEEEVRRHTVLQEEVSAKDQALALMEEENSRLRRQLRRVIRSI